MKGFVLVLLCALVAVQGRYTSIGKSSTALAELGENPSVVHLRLAVSTSGLLRSAEGSLISPTVVLTAASGIVDARFIWVRYGAVNVINPSLVTENSAFTLHPAYNPATGENNVALININRYVQSTDTISPVALALSPELPASAKVCVYQGEDIEVPGDVLKCAQEELVEEDGVVLAVGDLKFTQFNVGASVVDDNVQVGIITSPEGVVTPVSEYRDWIEEVTGAALPSPGQESETAVIPEAVRFVNNA